jgi:pyruvate formate lyase activating enzyme
VTFSGGEPLFQPAFLQALLEACKAHEIHTAVDTSGFAAWETLDAIRPYVDLFLYDLKLMDDTRHRCYTGVSNRLILSNLQALAGHGHRIQVRTPIVPGINDDDDNIRELGAFAATLPGLEGVTPLPYHQTGTEKYASLGKTYELTSVRPPSDERMAAIAATLAGFGLHVKAGG